MSDTKLCTSCAEHISVQAAVCKHCQRSQGWWGTFDRAVSALPLILATFSAIAVVLAFAKPWFFPPQSELIASFQRYTNERISFVVTNVGDRAGAVEQVILYFWHKDGGTTSFELPVEAEDETLVRPASTVRVTAVTPQNLKELIWTAYQTKRDDRCLLDLQMVRSGGTRQNERVETPCWQAAIAALPERRREIMDGLPQYSQ
ncbi:MULTISPECIES: hypothetical protein [unclassified Sinorhizobium]|uniref:hypothetical protein n=1 Tax=unclassified Sinorhizobium TaxID=2613772 RepID=UPI003524C126